MRRIEYALPYILLQKVYKKYHVVDEMHPVAGTYKVHLAGERAKNAGYKAKSLFLGRCSYFIVLVFQVH